MKKINNNENAIELIIEEFEGKITQEEKAGLHEWVNADPENEIIYREFLEIRNNLDILAAYRGLDSDKSWGILERKLESGSPRSISSALSKRIWWLSAAAILICILSITLYQTFNSKSIILNTLANQQRQFRLPDGSFVVMNENTSIKYSEHGFGKKRVLDLLQGEAFFEVVHDPSKIFQINMGDLRVTDIGTSFIVKKSDAEISVIVSSGKVAFEKLSTGSHVILDPGKKGIFLPGSKTIIDIVNRDINYKSWVDKKLDFRNTELSQVATELEKTYGSKVILENDALKERRLNATLNCQTIDSALLVISTSLQLKVQKAGSQYILGYK